MILERMTMDRIGKIDKKVKIINLGCKLNQFEGMGILQKLVSDGFSEIKNGKVKPDVFVINTCTVTGKSDRKSRHAIYRAIKDKKEGAVVIVTGCMAQTDRDELAKIEGIDLIVGNDLKASLPEIVKALYVGIKNKTKTGDLITGSNTTISSIKSNPFDFALPFTSERSRAFLKVQDGCDMRCAYCKVPLARGKSISRPISDILEAFRKLLDRGYTEIVLTGVNLGAYNYEGTSLAGLLERCLGISGKWRIRLSSIEPLFIKDCLIDVLGDEKICPHFHIPLQSGSDMILKKMNRGYDSERFRVITEKIKRIKSDVHLATDIIVGFPFETEEDFLKTVKLVEEVGFASLHVFKYSPRKGTSSENFKETVPENEKKRRSEYLIEKSEHLSYQYRNRYLNTRREVIIEKHKRGAIALTDNYIRVLIDEKQKVPLKLYGKLATVCINRVEPTETYGEIV